MMNDLLWESFRTAFAAEMRSRKPELVASLISAERERCAKIIDDLLRDQQSYVYLPEVESALAKIRGGE